MQSLRPQDWGSTSLFCWDFYCTAQQLGNLQWHKVDRCCTWDRVMPDTGTRGRWVAESSFAVRDLLVPAGSAGDGIVPGSQGIKWILVRIKHSTASSSHCIYCLWRLSLNTACNSGLHNIKIILTPLKAPRGGTKAGRHVLWGEAESTQADQP